MIKQQIFVSFLGEKYIFLLTQPLYILNQ